VICRIRHLVPGLLLYGCTHGSAGSETGPRAGSTPEPPGADLVVANGSLMIAGYSGTTGNVVLRRTERGYEIAEVGPGAVMGATDTLDAAGLFVHIGMTLTHPSEVTVGRPGLLLLRAGLSAGDSIVVSVGFSDATPVRRFGPEDNRPAQDSHPAVGCYSVDRSEWDDPEAAESLQRVVVPESLRLHWQYAGLLGREQALVATDAAGRIPGAQTTYHFWRPGSGDSVTVNFGTGYQAAVFRLIRDGEHLRGVVRKMGHRIPGPMAVAAVTLRREPCM
jgi:hypothetical protein